MSYGCTVTYPLVWRKVSNRSVSLHKVLILDLGTPPPDNLSQPLAVDNPSHSANIVAQETNPFEKYDPLLHAGVTQGTSRRSKKSKMEVLSLAFVKKYIQYAKARPSPVLTKEAADWIVSVYSALRNDEIDANNRRVGLSSLSMFFQWRLTNGP